MFVQAEIKIDAQISCTPFDLTVVDRFGRARLYGDGSLTLFAQGYGFGIVPREFFAHAIAMIPLIFAITIEGAKVQFSRSGIGSITVIKI